LALVYRRKGEWQRSTEYFQQALELSPADTTVLNEEVSNFEALRQYPQALKTLDRLLEIIPGNPAVLAYKVAIYQDQGNLTSAADILAPLRVDANSPRVIIQMQLVQWTYERHYAKAITLLKAVLEKREPETDWEKIEIQAELAALQQLSNDTTAARHNWEEVRAKIIEEQSRSKRKDFLTRHLASAYVALGDEARAFSAIKEAAEAFSQRRSNDAMAVYWIPETTARIAARAGDKDMAIEQLVIAAKAAFGANYGDLKFSPDWDALRGDPRFEKIVASLAPK
jgi:tetratricopeptide (TPR) repeat protein